MTGERFITGMTPAECWEMFVGKDPPEARFREDDGFLEDYVSQSNKARDLTLAGAIALGRRLQQHLDERKPLKMSIELEDRILSLRSTAMYFQHWYVVALCNDAMERDQDALRTILAALELHQDEHAACDYLTAANQKEKAQI